MCNLLPIHSLAAGLFTFSHKSNIRNCVINQQTIAKNSNLSTCGKNTTRWFPHNLKTLSSAFGEKVIFLNRQPFENGAMKTWLKVYRWHTSCKYTVLKLIHICIYNAQSSSFESRILLLQSLSCIKFNFPSLSSGLGAISLKTL